MHLTKPPIKKIDLHFPLGKEVTARNLRGVTIKDALDAIHKSYKKRVRALSLPDLPVVSAADHQADDELEKPYLAGFEWDKEESWTRLVVHLQSNPTATSFGAIGGKGKKNKKDKE